MGAKIGRHWSNWWHHCDCWFSHRWRSSQWRKGLAVSWENPFPLSVPVGRKQKSLPPLTPAFLHLQLLAPLHDSVTHPRCYVAGISSLSVSCKYMHGRMTAFQELMRCNNSHFLFINHFSNTVNSHWSLVKDWIINPPAHRKYWGGPFHSESFAAATHPDHPDKGHTVDKSTR